MSGYRHRPRRPGRKTATRTPRRRILILCEGKVTEPSYFRGFMAWRRNPLVEIVIPDRTGVPRTLVDAAKELKGAAQSQARKEKDDNLLYDEVWCVFDVDEHPNLAAAINKAVDNEIEVAISNPCFELWLLLHFRDSPGAQDRQTVGKLLKAFLPNYEKFVDFSLLEEFYEAARDRAERLGEIADEDGERYRNPTTGVYRVTESIAQARGPVPTVPDAP